MPKTDRTSTSINPSENLEEKIVKLITDQEEQWEEFENDYEQMHSTNFLNSRASLGHDKGPHSSEGKIDSHP